MPKSKNRSEKNIPTTLELLGQIYPGIRQSLIDEKKYLTSKLNDFKLFLIGIFAGIVGNFFVESTYRFSDLVPPYSFYHPAVINFVSSLFALIIVSVIIYCYIIRKIERSIKNTDNVLQKGLIEWLKQQSNEKQSLKHFRDIKNKMKRWKNSSTK